MNNFFKLFCRSQKNEIKRDKSQIIDEQVATVVKKGFKEQKK